MGLVEWGKWGLVAVMGNKKRDGMLLLCPQGVYGAEHFYFIFPVRGEALQKSIVGCVAQNWGDNMLQNMWLEQDPDCCAFPPYSVIPGVRVWHIRQQEFGRIQPRLVAWLDGLGGNVVEAAIRLWVARKLAGTSPILEALCFGGETPELFAKRLPLLKP